MHADFHGKPLFQATKQHLTFKWFEMICIYIYVGYLPAFGCGVLGVVCL